MASIEIRDAEERDIAGVMHIFTESGIDSGKSFTDEEAREQYARLRLWPNFRLLVAVVDGEIAGTYSLLIMEKLGETRDSGGSGGGCSGAALAAGAGDRAGMMEHARAECRRAGCYKLALSSNLRRTGAHRFYDSLGFERHGFSFVTEF